MERRVIRNLSKNAITVPIASASPIDVENLEKILYYDRYIGIESIKQTTTSSESSGINIITVTLTDGTTSTFEVRNGQGFSDDKEYAYELVVASVEKLDNLTPDPGTFAYVQKTKDTYFYTGENWVKFLDEDEPADSSVTNDDIDMMFIGLY